MRKVLAGGVVAMLAGVMFVVVILAMMLTGGFGGTASACDPTAGSTGQFGSSQVADAESKLGTPLAWSRDYVPSWTSPVTPVAGHTTVLSINSSGTSWAAIASGAQDAQIRRQAAEVARLPGTVYLAFHHEPENDPAAGSPASYVAAWRHYVEVYRAAGVTNVQWTWIMMADSFNNGGTRAASYYPGDDMINVVAADGYNWQGVRPGAGRSFAEVFAGMHTFAVAHGKPAIVAEVGMSAQSGRPAWITAAQATATSWPELRATLWYDARDFVIGADAVPALRAWAGASSGTPTTPNAVPVAYTPNVGEQQVWDALRQTWAPIQAAGIMGNMQSESGFNPLIVQGGGESTNPADAGSGGYGLVQWTPGAKLIPLLHGQPPSIASESAALTEQLTTGSERAAGLALAGATTVTEAAVAFETLYERHAGGLQPVRVTQAEAIYARHSGDSSIVPVADTAACQPETVGADTGGSGAVTWALGHLGIPYLWGGCYPGVPSCGRGSGPADQKVPSDCSGFSSAAVWFGAGISIPRTAAAQYAALPGVAAGQEKSGDLLFSEFGPGGPGHVMIVVTPGDPGLAVEEPHTGDVSKTIPYHRSGVTFGRPS